MRRLLLLRHAKTERPTFGGDDLARRLTARGRNDAPKMGAYMARHALVPDRAIISPSARTRETWTLVAAEFAAVPAHVFEDRLYEAGTHGILQMIQDCGTAAATLMLVGHNPAIQELALWLTASGEVEARQRLNEKFPTSGLAVIDFALDDWAQLHPQSGRLDHFVSPRTLHPATD